MWHHRQIPATGADIPTDPADPPDRVSRRQPPRRELVQGHWQVEHLLGVLTCRTRDQLSILRAPPLARCDVAVDSDVVGSIANRQRRAWLRGLKVRGELVELAGVRSWLETDDAPPGCASRVMERAGVRVTR